MKRSWMLRSAFWKLAAPCILIVAAALTSVAMPGDTIADRVLGQYDFVHSAANLIDGQGYSLPQTLAIDTSVTPNRLYVADLDNARVLGYSDVTALVNGSPADLVIGQPDFITGTCNNSPSASRLCGPQSVAVDASGHLYVGEGARVLEYDSPYGGCGSLPCVAGPANRVFGQGGSFTSNACNFDTAGGHPTANDLCATVWGAYVAVDASGNLYVSDQGNNRVLEYDNPLTNSMANRVFGQSGSFTSNTCNLDGICNPAGLGLDSSGHLYVADNFNNSVIEYNTPLTSSTPNLVFGGSCGGTSASSLCSPNGVALDASGDLYIVDWGNNRVLEYNTPHTNTTANEVFGQDDNFNSGSCNSGINGSSTASGLCGPGGAGVDANGNLYVVDTQNNRVLEYNTPLTNTTADVALGQLDFAHDAANLIDGRGYSGPESVAIDASVTPNRLYIADSVNSRVLGYKDVTSFVNGGAADLVIGQPDFLSGAGNNGGVSANSLKGPNGVAVDGGGNLYVADEGNHRVLEYDAPFPGCAGSFPCVGGGANRVFGQGGSFTMHTANNGGVSANSLDFPFGVAVDGGGNLYVADTFNHRVLEYNTPLTTDTTADTVFGQDGSFITGTQNNGGVGANSLDAPEGVAVDGGGNLYVADEGNSRVLEYNTPLTTDTTADTVFGQGGSFTTHTADNGGVSANSLDFPVGVAVDGGGNLYIADSSNRRVLEYNTPRTTDTTADTVFGQGGSFTTNTGNNGGVSANSLNFPVGVALDAGGNLYVADSSNNRVLEYDNPLATLTPTPTATATATTTETATATDTATATATDTATATATNTATATATATATDTATATATATPTATPTTSISVPASLAFGNAPVGDTATKNITVKNTGHGALFVGNVTSNDPEFAATGATTCPGGGLAPTMTCTIAIGFTPSGLGAHSATISVNDNASSSPQHVAASGTGIADMTVTPASFMFISTKIGAKRTKSITVHNFQTMPVTLTLPPSFSGTNMGDFSVTGGTCLALSPPSTLAAKTTCTLIVTYAPTQLGTESATMTVTDSPDTLGPYMVSFTTAENIPATVVPAVTLAFGTTTVAHPNKTKNITVTNLSGSSLLVSEGSTTGPNAGDFAVTGGTCGASVAANLSCTIAVTFTPTLHATAESASIAVTIGSDPTSPHNIALTGTGP